MFRYEMHLHTAPCSACGVQTMAEAVETCVRAGYAGFVVTNHFYHGNTGIDRALSWEDFVEAYAADWRMGARLGREAGIDVLFGLEEGYAPGKEVLLYGLTPEDVAAAPFLREKGLAPLSAYVRQKGGVVVHAHPFRIASYIPDPDWTPDPALLDGVEVYNAHGDSRNELALAFAEENGLPGTSGGDVHRTEQFGRAGIAVEERLRDPAALAAVLKSGRYRLIREGRITSSTGLHKTETR